MMTRHHLEPKDGRKYNSYSAKLMKRRNHRTKSIVSNMCLTMDAYFLIKMGNVTRIIFYSLEFCKRPKLDS